MDVEALLDDAAVLLDLTETSLERIIHTILTKERDISLPLAQGELNSGSATQTSPPENCE